MYKIQKLKKNVYRCRLLYLLVLPSLISLFIFHYIPIYGVQIAFKDYRTSLGIVGSQWVGLKHFKKFVEYPYFTKMLINTLKINLLSLCTFPIPVIFAIMLNEMKNQKLKYLLDHPGECKCLGTNAYTTMTDTWNAEVAAERLINLSKKLLEGEKHPYPYTDGPCSKAEILKG